MESTMDIAQLVAQMQDTLTTIHTTLASLNTAEHDAKLDELEARRDSTIKHLLAAFSAESEVLHHKRKTQREEIAERRRIEDEERERRRRQEDEELAERDRQEDEARDGRLLHETNEVEEETDHLMNEVEEEAQRAIDEGQKKLMNLEERRKELNRLIEEQLRVPLLPSPPKRSRRGSNMPPTVATPSKPPEPVTPESLNNDSAKALEPEDISTSKQDEITDTTSDSQTTPPADMVKETISNTNAETQKQTSPTSDSRPTSRQDRPLFVQPVISRSGTIIHADHLQQEAPVTVEPIGIPKRNTDSPDSFDSPKPDVTWWENKRREEAERALHHPATPSPLSSHSEAGEPEAPSQLPAQHEVNDAGLSSSSQAAPDASLQVAEKEDGVQPTEGIPAMPRLDVDETFSRETPRGMSHASDNIIASTTETVSTASDSGSEYDLSTADHPIEAAVENETPAPQNLNVPKHEPAPEEIPLPLTATGDTFDSAGDASFESAYEQPAKLASALSDHTRSHSGEHVTFAPGEERRSPHATSFEPAEGNGTPEDHGSGLSAHGDAASSASSYHDQPGVEYHTTSDDLPDIALSQDMDDSCSLTDASEYCQHEELSGMHHPHRPPLIHSGSYTGDEEDAVEVDIPLQRVPSHQPSRGEFSHKEVEDDQHVDSEHETDASHALAPTCQEQELEEHPQTPSLQVIPENEALETKPVEAMTPEPEEHGAVALGVEGDGDAGNFIVEHDPHRGSDVGHDEDMPALSSSSEHGDHSHSFYDDDSHLEDDYAQPEPNTPNPLILQPFRTSDSGDRGSPVRDRDVPELPDGVGQHGEGDVEPGVSGAGGQPGDHADLGVLRDDGDLGGGGAEREEEEAQESLVIKGDDASDTALPSAGLKTEESVDDQLRRTSQVSNESVELQATYTTTVNGEGELFDDDDEDDDEDEDDDAESDDVSDIEDAYLNEEGVVDAVVAAMGPEPPSEEHAEEDVATEKTPVDKPIEAPVQAPIEAPMKVEADVAAASLVDAPLDSPVDAVLDTAIEATVEMPVQMGGHIEAETRIQVADETPYATPMEVPAPVELKTQVLNAVGASGGDTPIVSVTVPAIETPEPDHPATSPNWVNEADGYFDEQDEELDQRQDTPRHQLFEQQGTDPGTGVASDSQPASRGLSANIHDSDRPQTPDQDTDVAYQDHLSTLVHGQEEQHSSPQSVRSQSTIDSAPPSPEQHTVTDTHDPVIRGLVSTQSPSYQTGRPRNDSHLTEYGHHRDEFEDTPFAKWQQRDSSLSMTDQPAVAPLNNTRSSKHSHTGSESGDQKGGSLFQRMRNVFEQQSHASEINTSRSSYSRPISSTSSDRHSGGGGGGGSGLWGSGGPLSGRFGKSWSSSSNDHHHHRDYHHSPYTGAGYYSPVRGSEADHDAVDQRSGLLGGREDLN
ncbi:hypothetical protein QBC41DRAFT_98254 [Cercophora samala]|uniref:Uncharacterized protein n=1 Tax=Cercophora samala TaxID=330535 RepID=A0AA39ZFP6_9PEZI|nr:hypothetical protein QBC41DRAFT_98254 [Cercophora samala]